MTTRMRRDPHISNPQPLPKFFKISQKIPIGELCVVFTSKNILAGGDIKPTHITEEDVAELCRKRHKTVFAALADDAKGELVQIYVFLFESKRFTDTDAAVKKQTDEGMRSEFSRQLWLPVKKRIHR